MEKFLEAIQKPSDTQQEVEEETGIQVNLVAILRAIRQIND